MKKTIITLFATCLSLLVALIWLASANTSLKNEKERYRADVDALAIGLQKYKIADSLNVAQIGVLTLTAEEYKMYRHEDAQVIAELTKKNRELQSASKVATKTITKIETQVRDSIVYVEHTARDTFRCISVATEWYDFQGCEHNGQFKGEIANRDYLLISVSAEYKRFLGFLWKTSKIKNRHVDVVSKNPNTEITGVEYIEIR